MGSLLLLSTLNLQPSTARAQDTMFTYQGRVTVGGTDFTGTGEFKFALVTSTNFNHQAHAVANMNGLAPNEFVSTVSVTDGGNGYPAPPAVNFSGGGGSGATAQANLSGGTVSGITVLTPGSGYSSAPTVTIDPPPPNIAYVTYWSNDGTSVNGGEPSAAVSVAVSNGLFTVMLGDTSLANMAAIDASLFTQPDLELRIWFNDGVHGFAALSPTQRLTPAPYALGVQGTVSAAQLTGTIPAGQIGGTYSEAVTFNNGSNGFTGVFSGDGGSLTNLSSTSLVLVSTNTSLTSWGWNQYGQRSFPTNAQNIVAIAGGEFHSLALRADGTVLAWGAGQTNNPSNGYDYGQSIVPAGLNNVTAISAGATHSLALRADGTVVAWGDDTYGQTNVPPGLSAIAVSASAYHNLALKADGTVVAWGAGATNTGTSPDWGQSLVPPGLNNVTAVAAGVAFSAALKSDGTVVVWGGEPFGVTNLPPGLNNVIAISAGGAHVLALKNDGTVVAWGAGTTNDPGSGLDYGQAIVPAGLSNVVAIAAGLVNSVALRADGTAVAWGDDQFGESSVPAGLNNMLALAAGPAAAHVLATRKQSDAPVAWLNSDNTFNGNVTINGDTTVSGEMRASDLRLDDGNLWLRGGNDQNNGLGWYSAGTKNFTGSFYNNGPNGPVLFGEGGGALGSSGTNGQQVALVWDAAQHVGIGTTAPLAPLDFGSYPDATKLRLGGYGIGVTNSQLIFHLGGSYGSFSFRNAPNGNEWVNIQQNGLSSQSLVLVHGQVWIGDNAQYKVPGTSELDPLRIVRGRIAANGSITTGAGFTVTKTGTGAYTITFTTAFSDQPTITATPQVGLARIATCTNVGAGSFQIRTFDVSSSTAVAVDQDFHFIAIGPQ